MKIKLKNRKNEKMTIHYKQMWFFKKVQFDKNVHIDQGDDHYD